MWSLRFGAIGVALLLAVPPRLAGAEAERSELVVTGAGGAHEFTVELADDDRERATGLMYRRSMPRDAGMLFDFENERSVSFWMANTYIPLDMIFIRADGTIKSIAERTTPLSQRGVPEDGVRYVLEINGGLSDELGIRPGDKVSGEWIEAQP
jgi:uncharacterized membrane protein (UPF0127 family)